MEILRSFLVNLGFRVDGSGERRFNTTVDKATKNVVKLGAALEAVGVATAAVVTKMSDHFEGLYYASQRIGSSVENIRGFGFALSQMGGSAEGARNALESIAEFMRSNPGGEGFLRGLGVQTRQANGELRDTAEIVKDLGAAFRRMPYSVSVRYGGLLGIDPRTLQAMLRDTGEFDRRFSDMSRRAGVNQQAFALQGRNFARAVRDLRAQLTVLGEAVFMNLSVRVLPVLEQIGTWIDANGPLIAKRLTGFLSGVWNMSVMVARVGAAIIDFFVRLDGATHGASTALLGLLAAWRILNLGALATPLGAAVGAVLALGAALAGLVDDFNTWAKGGDSLFDWSWWAGTAKVMGKAADDIGKAFTDKLLPALGDLFKAFGGLVVQLAPLAADLAKALGPMAMEVAKAGIDILTIAVRTLTVALKAARTAWAALSGDTKSIRGIWKPEGGAAPTRAPPAHPEKRSFLRDLWNGLTGHGGLQPQGHRLPNAPTPSGPEFMPRRAGDLAQQAIAYFRSQGWSREQAAGIAANIQHESGFNTRARNPASGMRGLVQWDTKRRAAFRQVMGVDVDDSSFAQQLDFIQYELTKGAEVGAGNMLHRARSAGQAAIVFNNAYERNEVGVGEQRARASTAERFALRAPAGAAGGTTLNQTTTIHVAAGANARETGREVASQQGRVNADLLRNSRYAQ